MDTEKIATMLIEMNKMLLGKKAYIKEYKKLRKLHSEILDSMNDYMSTGKYDINEHSDSISYDLAKEIPNVDLTLDSRNPDDITILDELFIYRNHPEVVSLTDIYLRNNKFRNKDKVKLLECMRDSYVSLFKIVDIDFSSGYVTYEDVFTKKRHKIIDIAMSSTMKVDKKLTIYFYNRIITFDDISFGTGMHCVMTSDNKQLMEFLKKHKNKKRSDFARCILLYDIAKKEEVFKMNYNNSY